MKKKQNLYAHLIEEMNNYSKLINEAYTFDEDTASYDENDMVDEYPDDEEDSAPNAGIVSDKISQIRAIALEGIQEYADDVDSEEYDFFKKIWLMCDKVCSGKENEKENNI